MDEGIVTGDTAIRLLADAYGNINFELGRFANNAHVGVEDISKALDMYRATIQSCRGIDNMIQIFNSQLNSSLEGLPDLDSLPRL